MIKESYQNYLFTYKWVDPFILIPNRKSITK